MGNRISKTSDAAIARTTFDLVKADTRQSYKDKLALELLREDGSMAYNTLTTLLKEGEITTLGQQIESMILSQPINEV